MRITDLYPEVVSEDIKYEYKAELIRTEIPGREKENEKNTDRDRHAE